jgi:hypothetical protein
MAETLSFPGPVITILTILLGIVLLVGFLAGLVLTVLLLKIQPEWLGWVIALAAGGVGILLAVFMQRVAVTIAGFVMGGLVLVWLAQTFTNVDQLEWLIFLIGGVIGALLVTSLFEVALIGLSSLAGAMLIVGVTNLSPSLSTALLFGLILVGIVIQSRRLSLA